MTDKMTTIPERVLLVGQDGNSNYYLVVNVDDQGRIVLSPTSGAGGSIATILANTITILGQTGLISAQNISANPAYIHDPQVDQADIIVAQMGLIKNKPSPTSIQIAEITTPGLIRIWRYRKGTDAGWTLIVAGGGMAAMIGGIYYTYTFPNASWQNGDQILYEIYNTVITVGGEVFTLATVQGFGCIGASTLVAAKDRLLFSVDYWSIPQLSVVVPAGAATQTMPDVVVAALPAGITVIKATAMFKFRSITNAGAVNMLNGAQHIQVQKGGAGGFADAISLITDQFTIAAATVDAPGDVVVGDHNVVAKVDGNATYNFQWTSACADVAGLTFNDVQVGLKIWYSV